MCFEILILLLNERKENQFKDVFNPPKSDHKKYIMIYGFSFYFVFRYLAHNGEINTLRGNKNLMAAREGVMHSAHYGDSLHSLYPVVEKDMSDSGAVDNVLEFLCMAGGR